MADIDVKLYCKHKIEHYADICNRWAKTRFTNEKHYYYGQVEALTLMLEMLDCKVKIKYKHTKDHKFNGYESIKVDGEELVKGGQVKC